MNIKKSEAAVLGTIVIYTIFFIYWFFFYKYPFCVRMTEFSVFEKPEPSDIEPVKKEIETFGYMWIPLTGTSMEPTIHNYSFCMCRKEPYYDIGDIITYYTVWPDGRFLFITHRIVDKEITSNGIIYTTKGDNNPWEDVVKINESQIFCKIVEDTPFERLLKASWG